MNIPSFINKEKIRKIAVPVLILITALILSQAIINPGPRIVKAVFLCAGIMFFLSVKQEYLIYSVLFLVLFPKHLSAVFTTSNGAIIILSVFLLIRYVVQGQSVVSLERIVNNKFFLPSVFIFLAYLISWLRVYASDLVDMHHHNKFMVGITCALILGNIITGFVCEKKYFFRIHYMMIGLLILNLIFGLLSLFNQHIVFIPGIAKSGSVFVGSGDDFALRLGGLIFFWEAYAEYLMMACIILLGLFLRLKKLNKKYKILIFTLLFFSFVELLLTNTRGAFILTLASFLLLIFFFSGYRQWQKIFILFIFGFILLSGLIVAEKTGYFSLFNRFKNFTTMDRSQYGYVPEGRASVWLPVIEYISDNGLNGSGPSFIPISRYRDMGGQGYLFWPHNILLLILSTTGGFGLSAYLYLFFQFWISRQKIFNIRAKYLRYFYSFLFMAICFFIADEMKFDGSLRQTNSYFYHTWIIMAFYFSGLNFGDVKK